MYFNTLQMIEFVFFQGAKVQLFGLYTTGLVITFHFVDNLSVVSEQKIEVREQRAESSEQRLPHIGMRIFASCGRGDLQIVLCWARDGGR